MNLVMPAARSPVETVPHDAATFDPRRPDFMPYGLTCVHWRPSAMRRPDHHNEIELNFVESGSLTYILGGRKTPVDCGRLRVFWAAIPHQVVDFASATSYFVATIPLPWFLQWQLPGSLVRPLLRGLIATEPSADLAMFDTELFARWESDLSENNGELVKAVLLEMQARLLRLALNLPADSDGFENSGGLARHGQEGLNRIERMACFIAEHYTERISLKQIGAFVKLHPNYAMRVFHKKIGTTVVDYLTQHRVSHAQRLLAMTDLKIADVAMDSGFCSMSRFNNAFRRACGCTPRDYRKMHQVELSVHEKRKLTQAASRACRRAPARSPG